MKTRPERFAPDGWIWVCFMCGKISPHDRHGDKDSMKMWDVSCVTNSELVLKDKVLINPDTGLVHQIKADAVWDTVQKNKEKK